MSRKSRGPLNVQTTLKKLSKGRLGCIDVCKSVKPFGPEYRVAVATLSAIDDLVEQLTGDRTHFHDKPHTAGS